jgi:hypothetical protein
MAGHFPRDDGAFLICSRRARNGKMGLPRRSLFALLAAALGARPAVAALPAAPAPLAPVPACPTILGMDASGAVWPMSCEHLSAQQVLKLLGYDRLSERERWQMLVNAFPPGGLRYAAPPQHPPAAGQRQ